MTDPDPRLEEIRQREQKATKGPWFFHIIRKGVLPPGHAMIGAVAPGHQIRASPRGGSYPSNDGDFIAHSREDIPYLLNQLAEARLQVAQAEAAVVDLQRQFDAATKQLAELEKYCDKNGI